MTPEQAELLYAYDELGRLTPEQEARWCDGDHLTRAATRLLLDGRDEQDRLRARLIARDRDGDT